MEGRLIMLKRLFIFMILVSLAFGQWNYDYSTGTLNAKLLGDVELTGDLNADSVVVDSNLSVLGKVEVTSKAGTSNKLISINNATGLERYYWNYNNSTAEYSLNSDTDTDILYITRSGKIGMGTASPSAILDISYGSGVTPPRITSTDTEDAVIRFYDTTAYSGGIGWDRSSDLLGIYGKNSSGTPAIAVDNADNVALVADLDVGDSLSVDGNATFDGTTEYSGKLSIGTDGTLSWGSAKDFGKLTWDTGEARVISQAGKALNLYTTDAGINQLYLATGGQNIMGHNASMAIGATEPVLQVEDGDIGLYRWVASSSATRLRFAKSRNATPNSYTIVQDNDVLGSLSMHGDDGTNIATEGARITAKINGTPAENRMPTDLEFYTALGGADDDIALGAVLGKDAMLDLYGGTISILAGADDAAKTRTDATNKRMRFAVPHYTNAEEPVGVLFVTPESGKNEITIGGGTSSMNAATSIRIFAADDITTTTGTEVARFEGGAAKATMMGLGNSSLEAWQSGWSIFQLGGNASWMSNTTQGVSTSIYNLHNAYYDGAWKYISADEASRYYQQHGRHTFDVATAGASADDPISWTTAFQISNDATITTTGGRVHNVTTVNAATYDLLVTDYICHVTYTGTGAVTSFTLPTAQTVSGRTIIIKDAGGNAGTNNITIDTEGAETIDGAGTLVINSDYSSVSLYSDGSNWFIQYILP